MSTENFSHDDLERTARERFGWDDLQGGQIEAVEALLQGRDVLAVMPTGYGKSAIYQLAAALLGGVTVVVSPLIALQTDQVAGLAELPNAPAAVAINSSLRPAALEAAWQRVSGPDGGIVYLAPEQLAKDETVERLRDLGVTLFAVDEAHCVTAWGHDFRPDYLRLGDVIERLGHPRTVALTATGSSPVRRDIAERLHLRDRLEITRGFDRPNLWLEVTRHVEASEKERAVIEQVTALSKPGLLYVATRADTERYAAELEARGLRAAAYHGGLRAADRRAVHDDFTSDRVDVVVATSAFGMGIDKPNVRFVVHAAVPESVDEYYQEIGRAGRDGEPAAANLHYRSEDLGLRKFFASRKPDEDALRRAYTVIAHADKPVKATELARELDISSRAATGLVNALADAGMVRVDRRGSTATSSARAHTAVSAAVEVIEERERIEESRLEMMRGYAETTDCRRLFLLGYFGEQHSEPCGNCDVCRRSGNQTPEDGAGATAATSTIPFSPQSSVVHTEWGPGTVMRVEDDRLTVFFEHEGYKVLSLELVTENGLLQTA
ncbi:ATP-dependent DNA helicase RecQ [Okibacterium sp. HSC-33S16]|uniref:RecQ family ATP-dependent DNA helicase n=1 Tax=Okibacterium sp. HSC-33S16 TaxID=2910965 RepID=UPI0020A1357F|nr:RecQ family ATP-dependent DNA helicase [Okibacterium sp. HSC-33S16]MCP2031344.1 ATP-dependent DNA helicase RecQ [Okibacterium sp. HSC-33S16]